MASPAIVGRTREWDIVRGAVDRLPRSSVVLIEGEAGIGKTTLLDAAVDYARGANALVFRCAGDDLDSSVPYSTLVGPGVSTEGIDTSIGSPIDWLDEIGLAGADTPIVLAVDDLQWADPSTLTALAPLVRRLIDVGAVVLLACRSGQRPLELEALIDRLGSMGLELLRIDPLSDVDVLALAESALGRSPSVRLADLVQRAGGNPLYVTALLTSLEAEGELVDAGDVIDVNEVRVLAPLRSMIGRRVRLLGDDVFTLLRSASVFGRSFDIGRLARLTGTGAGDVARVVTLAADAGVVDGEPGDPTGGAVVFRHDLVREALYHDVLPPVRAGMHRQVVDLLLADRRPLSELVPHLLRMDLREDDVPLVLDACALGTPQAQVRLLERALDVTTSGRLRDVIEIRRVDALIWTGDAVAALAEADALLAHRPRLYDVLPLRITRLRALQFLGRVQDAVHEHVPLPDDAGSDLRAREAANLTVGSMIARDAVGGERWASIALAHSVEPADLVLTQFGLGWIRVAQGRFAESEDHVRLALDHSGPSHPHGVQLGPMLVSAFAHLLRGDPSAAIEAVRAEERAGDDVSSLMRMPLRHLVVALAHLDAGRWDEAGTELDAGLMVATDHGVELVRQPLAAAASVLTLARSGVIHPRDPGRPLDQWSFLGELAMVRDAMRAEVDGDARRAYEVLRPAVDPASGRLDHQSMVVCAPRLVRSALECSGRAEAAEVLALAASAVNRGDAVGRLTIDWCTALVEGAGEFLAELAADTGHRPFVAAQLLDDAARSYAARGAVDDARDVATRAVLLHQQMGAAHLERRLRDAMRDEGVRIRVSGDGDAGAPTSGWDALSVAEHRVLSLLVDGRTNAEIATELITSRRTVEAHLVSVYKKLGMGSRLELTRFLLTRE